MSYWTDHHHEVLTFTGLEDAIDIPIRLSDDQFVMQVQSEAAVQLVGIFDEEGAMLVDLQGQVIPAGQTDPVALPQVSGYSIALRVKLAPGETVGPEGVEAIYQKTRLPMLDGQAPGPIGAGQMEVGVAVTSAIDVVGDVDWFEIYLEAGTTYRMTQSGAPWGDGTLDEVDLGWTISVDDIAGRSNGEFTGWRYNAERYITPDESGWHYVRAAGYGKATGTYTLIAEEVTDTVSDHIARATTLEVGETVQAAIEHRGDVDVWAITLEAGQDYDISTQIGGHPADPGVRPEVLKVTYNETHTLALGSAGVDIDRFVAPFTGTYHVHIGGGRNSYDLTVDIAAEDIGDTIETAKSIELGDILQSRIGRHDDVDVYHLRVEEPTVVTFSHLHFPSNARYAQFRLLDDTGAAGDIIYGQTFLESAGDYYFEASAVYYADAGADYKIAVEHSERTPGNTLWDAFDLTLGTPFSVTDHEPGQFVYFDVPVAGVDAIAVEIDTNGAEGSPAQTNIRVYTPTGDYRGSMAVLAGQSVSGQFDTDDHESLILAVDSSLVADTFDIIVHNTVDLVGDPDTPIDTGLPIEVGTPLLLDEDQSRYTVSLFMSLEANKTYKLTGLPEKEPDYSPYAWVRDWASGDGLFRPTKIDVHSWAFSVPETGFYDLWYDSGATNVDASDVLLSLTEITDDWPQMAHDLPAIGTDEITHGRIDFERDIDLIPVSLTPNRFYNVIIEAEDAFGDPADLDRFDIDIADDTDSEILDPYVENHFIQILPLYVGDDGDFNLSIESTRTGDYDLRIHKAGDDYGHDLTQAGMFSESGRAFGTHEFNRDSDFFALEVEAGQFYRITVENLDVPANQSYDHARVSGVFQSDGTTSIAGLDGYNLDIDRYEGWANFEAIANETLYLEVEDRYDSTSFGAWTSRDYELTVQTFAGAAGSPPYFTDDLSVGQPHQATFADLSGAVNYSIDTDPGVLYAVHLMGADTGSGTLVDPRYIRAGYPDDGWFDSYYRTYDDGGVGTNAITFIEGTGDRAYVMVLPETFASGESEDDSFTVLVEALPQEDDDARDGATLLQAGVQVDAELNSMADRDHYSVDLTDGGIYRLTFSYEADGTFIDIDHIRDETGYIRDIRTLGYDDTDGVYTYSYEINAAAGFAADFRVRHEGVFDSRFSGPDDDASYSVLLEQITQDNGRSDPDVVAIGTVHEGTLNSHYGSDFVAVSMEAGEVYSLLLTDSNKYDAQPFVARVYSPEDAAIYTSYWAHDLGALEVAGTSAGLTKLVDEDHLEFIAPVTGAYVFEIQGEYDRRVRDLPHDYALEVTALGYDAEPETARELPLGLRVTGETTTAEEPEIFELRLDQGRDFRVTVNGAAAETLSWMVEPFDPEADPDREMAFQGFDGATAYLRLDEDAEDTQYFRLRGQEAQTDFTLRVEEIRALDGTGGNDWLAFDGTDPAEVDVVFGADGFDMLSFAGLGHGIKASLYLDWVQNRGGVSFVVYLDDIEGVTGTSYGDRFHMGEGAYLRGLGGRDTFVFRDDSAELAGSSIHGGSGRDLANFLGLDVGVTVDLDRGRYYAEDDNGRIRAVERVNGTSHDDHLTGDHRNNMLFGGRGDDTFVGNAGNDVIKGSHGTDMVIYAGNKADYLVSTSGIRTEVTALSGDDGLDILAHVEVLRFADGDILL